MGLSAFSLTTTPPGELGRQRITAENRERDLDVYHQEVDRRRPSPRYFDRSDAQFTFLGMLPGLQPGDFARALDAGRRR